MNSNQEEVIIAMLGLKKDFEEAARDIQTFIDSNQAQKLSNHKCKKLLGILDELANIPNAFKKPTQ